MIRRKEERVDVHLGCEVIILRDDLGREHVVQVALGDPNADAILQEEESRMLMREQKTIEHMKARGYDPQTLRKKKDEV